MGKWKPELVKDREAQLQGMLKAQQMAEAFARHRARDFTKALLTDTGLSDELYQTLVPGKHTKPAHLEMLVTDCEHSMGKALALAYACGYCDAIQKKSIKTLYVPGKLAAIPDQPTLPGLPEQPEGDGNANGG